MVKPRANSFSSSYRKTKYDESGGTTKQQFRKGRVQEFLLNKTYHRINWTVFMKPAVRFWKKWVNDSTKSCEPMEKFIKTIKVYASSKITVQAPKVFSWNSIKRDHHQEKPFVPVEQRRKMFLLPVEWYKCPYFVLLHYNVVAKY